MNWRFLYRFLVAIRRALNVLIEKVRARAYPVSKGKRKRAAQPRMPLEAQEPPHAY